MCQHHHQQSLFHLQGHHRAKHLPIQMAKISHHLASQTRQAWIQCSQILPPHWPTWYNWQIVLQTGCSWYLVPCWKTPAAPSYTIQWATRSFHNRCHASYHTESKRGLEKEKSCTNPISGYTSHLPQWSKNSLSITWKPGKFQQYTLPSSKICCPTSLPKFVLTTISPTPSALTMPPHKDVLFPCSYMPSTTPILST